MTDPIRLERRGAVALLVLARPQVLNALDRATLECLIAHTGTVAADRDVRALVLTGEGRAFAAGADIAEMRALDPAGAQAFSALGHRALASLEALAVPTIAAVNGFALGGGCELALACDFIHASQKARFGQPEVNLGLLPGFGGTSRLVRRVGIAWAKELALSGEAIDAETALRIGLASRLHAPGARVDARGARRNDGGPRAAGGGTGEACDPGRAGRRGAHGPCTRADGVRARLRHSGSRRRNGRLPRKARREVHGSLNVARVVAGRCA